MFTWILGIAAGCIVLAFLLYFLVPARGVKVPAIVLGTLGGLAAGAVLGMLGAIMYGESAQKMVYGDLYRPEPMPSVGGPMKGGASPPSEKPAPKKKEGFAKKGRGPGMTNLPADYPGMEPAKKSEEPQAPPAEPVDAPK
jgi:hypothetical protein